MRPIADVAPSSITKTFSGGVAEITCGAKQDERYRCEFASYDNCQSAAPNVFECCSPFVPVPPLRNTSLVNHIWPENRDYPDLFNYLRSLPWIEVASSTQYTPRTFAWGLLLSIRQGNTYLRRTAVNDPSTCKLTLRNRISNKEGLPALSGLLPSSLAPSFRF